MTRRKLLILLGCWEESMRPEPSSLYAHETMPLPHMFVAALGLLMSNMFNTMILLILHKMAQIDRTHDHAQ